MSIDSPMNLEPAVLGERLSDSRRARGLTQQDAADAIGVARTTITAIEKGTRKPRASELARLLRLYGRSVAEFTLPSALPDAPPFLIQLRDFASKSPPESGRNQAIQQFEQLCRWYRELELDAGFDDLAPLPPPYALQSLRPALAGEMMAAAERNRLGLGDGPISNLWSLLETDVGVRIFGFPMNQTTISGMFVYSSDLGACVALNANFSAERQRWSLAHEYAHLLTDRYKAEISTLGERRGNNPSEQIANSFALHFLMPTNGLIRRFQALQSEAGGRVTPTELLQLSHLYGVSAEAMTHRLEDLNLIPADTWERLQNAGFKPGAAQRMLGIPSESTGKPRFPMRYVALCVRAYRSGALSEGQLAKRLMSDRVETRRIVEEFSAAEILRDDGVPEQLTLDLDLELLAKSR